MKKGWFLSVCVLLGLGLSAPAAQAQYFRFDNLSQQQINSGVPQLEVEAILKLFGSLVGGGLYDTADLHHVGGFDVGLRGIVSKVPDEFKSLPILVDRDYVGLGFLHASLGLPANLELIGRFFYLPIGSSSDLTQTPGLEADSRGGVTLIGGGLKYGLLQQAGLPKIMLMGTYHTLLVPSEYQFGSVNTVSFNGVISHSLAILSVYAGVGVDITTLKVDDTVPIPGFGGERFTENTVHGTFGVRVTPLPLVHVNGALNLGKFNSLELGLGISIR